MTIGSGVLLPWVTENRTFPILRALAYTTGLGYRPTCDDNSGYIITTLARNESKTRLLFNILDKLTLLCLLCVFTVETTTLETTTHAADNGMTLTNTAGN